MSPEEWVEADFVSRTVFSVSLMIHCRPSKLLLYSPSLSRLHHGKQSRGGRLYALAFPERPNGSCKTLICNLALIDARGLHSRQNWFNTMLFWTQTPAMRNSADFFLNYPSCFYEAHEIICTSYFNCCLFSFTELLINSPGIILKRLDREDHLYDADESFFIAGKRVWRMEPRTESLRRPRHCYSGKHFQQYRQLQLPE